MNWELWWPEFPILVYFKETQTKPEGQVHFFPVIFVSTLLWIKRGFISCNVWILKFNLDTGLSFSAFELWVNWKLHHFFNWPTLCEFGLRLGIEPSESWHSHAFNQSIRFLGWPFLQLSPLWFGCAELNLLLANLYSLFLIFFFFFPVKEWKATLRCYGGASWSFED